jgi:flagellar hook-associated protein 3 FlgL
MTNAISSRSILASLRQSVVRLQSELRDRTEELSTGKHSDIGIVLGNRASRLVSLRVQHSALQSMSDANDIIASRLDTTQNKLESIQSTAEDLLNSLLVSSTSNSDATTIRLAGEDGLSTMISELNASLGGDYLFAGTNTATKPITDYYGVGSTSKQALDAAFATTFGFAQSSSSVSSIGGTAMQAFLDTQFASLFDDPAWRNDWSSASDQELIDRISPTSTHQTSVSANDTVFRQLAGAFTMLADLGTENLGADAYEVVTEQAGDLLRSAISGLTDMRADIGLVQSDIEDANTQMSLQMDLFTTQVGNLENVDSYEVTTRLNELETQLEIAYSLTARLQDMSLARYL